jgi:hypothetical protein
MGDAGEGLVDAEARAQERRDEIERERMERRTEGVKNPEREREVTSLKLGRAALAAQITATVHERRKAQLVEALAEIDRRLAALHASK